MRPTASEWTSDLRSTKPEISAGVNDLCSNHWELPFTPDELRNMAAIGSRGRAPGTAKKYQPHELAQRLGGETVELLSKRVQGGESVRSLALELGVANSALTRMLREEGVEIRKMRLSAEDDLALANDYQAGQTVAEIEKQHNLSHNAVLRSLHRSGVEMRGKGRRRSD